VAELVAELVALVDELIPEAAGKITWTPKPLAVPALLADLTLGAVIGGVSNRPLREGIEETISVFRGFSPLGSCSFRNHGTSGIPR
jgi:hypothetical protein